MRVLVAGASGLIGGRLLHHLLRSGNIDVRAASRRERIWPDGVEGRVVPSGDTNALGEACRGVDVVINLAAMGERACAADPSGALVANAGGALAWASAASRCGVARFVQLSTAKVYGTELRGVVTEQTPTRPRSHYAVTMRAAEDYVSMLHPSAVVLRLSNGFGAPVGSPPGAWDTIVNEFCKQAVVDRRIVVRSAGSTLRNFVPMTDVVAAVGVAMESAAPGTYNLGGRRSRSLREAADCVAEACVSVHGFRPSIEFGQETDTTTGEPLDYRIDRLMGQGFNPSDAFEREIRATVDAAGRFHG